MFDEEKSFYLVNPSGAIHQMPHTLAKERLALPGWRMAEKEEISQYFKQKGNQRFDQPICKKFSPEPPKDQELPDQPMKTVKKTKTPRGE